MTLATQVVEILRLGSPREVVKHLDNDIALRLRLLSYVFPLFEALGEVLLQLVSHLVESIASDRVPEVLDGVVRAPQNHVGYLCPSVLLVSLKQEENPGFLCAPWALLEQRIQLVVPAFSTLLARSVLHLRSDGLPRARPYVTDQLHQGSVLLQRPSLLLRLFGRVR